MVSMDIKIQFDHLTTANLSVFITFTHISLSDVT